MWGTYGNGGALRFFHADHLGTPRQITDHVGTVAGRHNYYPFGAEVPCFGSFTYDDRICKYTSHERDRNGATDYMLGRTYFYPVKRFSTVDPGRDGWNLYAYVGGSPINFTDPTGNEKAQIQLDRDARELLNGEISKEEFQNRITARGVPAAAAMSLVVPGPEDVAIGFAAARFSGRLSQ